MSILSTLHRPFFVLAPMDDVTDTVFRQMVADCARPDLFFTEFVNVDGLQSPGRERLLKKLQFTPKEQPLIAQIWGKNPENYRKTANELVEKGFAGIDINMGCPIKVITNNGCCSALINNRELAVEIIKATQEGAAGRVPVSVKTRLGFNHIDFTWHELLLQQNLNMLTIHGRTRKEMSEAPVHWDAVRQIRELRDRIAPETLIVGNGDVESLAQAHEIATAHKLDGIMIGRGVFKDPFIFAKDSPWGEYTKEQKIALFTKHVNLFADTWRNKERRTATLNKFCKIYIHGFDGATALRSALMLAESPREILELLDNHMKAIPLATRSTASYDEAVSDTIKAIVFDSDGTVLDTRALILEGYKTVLRSHGLEHLASDHYIRQRLGKPVPETYEQIIAGHQLHVSVEQLAAEHDEVQNNLVNLIKPYPQAAEFLRQCKEKGVKLCLFTSGKQMMIERNFAGARMPNPYELFDAIITADDDIARKPEPDAILELLRRIEVDPKNAAVVGDHGYDIIAASRARVGLKVGVTHGFGTSKELLSAGADVLTDDFSGLRQLMRFVAD